MFDLERYRLLHILSRNNPAGLIETSRGCKGNCNFCNKNTFGRFFRFKSPERVVDEMFYMKSAGFREIHIADDSFSQNLDHAKKTFELLIKKKFDLPISLYSGVRVDCVDRDFFRLAKEAGVWSVSFGIESGNQDILNLAGKGITLTQIENSVTMANKEGLETLGFFMFGLAGETEQTMQETIEFSTKLPLSIAKFDMLVPLPGTRLFNEWDEKGLIVSKDWSNYLFHQTSTPLYNHPTVTWDKIHKYYNRAHRSFYLRPSFITKRLIRDIIKGNFWKDCNLLLRSISSLLGSPN